MSTGPYPHTPPVISAQIKVRVAEPKVARRHPSPLDAKGSSPWRPAVVGSTVAVEVPIGAMNGDQIGFVRSAPVGSTGATRSPAILPPRRLQPELAGVLEHCRAVWPVHVFRQADRNGSLEPVRASAERRRRDAVRVAPLPCRRWWPTSRGATAVPRRSAARWPSGVRR